MYQVAEVDEEICGKTSCRLCTQFCPEANTILFDRKRNTAFVAVDRCKGCGQCVWVCDNLARHHAIRMVMIDEATRPVTTRDVVFSDQTATVKSRIGRG